MGKPTSDELKKMEVRYHISPIYYRSPAPSLRRVSLYRPLRSSRKPIPNSISLKPRSVKYPLSPKKTQRGSRSFRNVYC